MSLAFPELTMLPLDRYAVLLEDATMTRTVARVAELQARLAGRVVWNVSSTAVGGGVAEMVRSLLSYARGAGVDARWVVISAPPEFFRFTKRLHHALHGSPGDGSPMGDAERRIYDQVNATNAAAFAPLVRADDIVVVHDPQPAGMVPAVLARGARVIWRCHIGHDQLDPEVERGWRFLAPYLRGAHAYVFSRAAYIPAGHLDASRAVVIAPTIDPFSAKNQPMDDRCVRSILRKVGVVHGSSDSSTSTFLREDGTPGRVDRVAEVVREGPPPSETAPLIVQVSRWDRLKDPVGVIEGFGRLAAARWRDVHLVLAGPSVRGVGDDPEGAAELLASMAAWRKLPIDVRRRVQLASLPVVDVDENAAIINALQRHATIIVQKSLHEGFGLTVTEGMWKSRPIVATAIGGIRDQIEDGVQGLLLSDPTDLDGFVAALAQLLEHPTEARLMGERGHERVLQRYLGLDSLMHFGALIESLDSRGPNGARSNA
jgi:trehalose synthase